MGFKHSVAALKHKRLKRLRWLFKGWTEYVAYKRLMLNLNVSLLKSQALRQRQTLQCCFSAVRTFKETQKYSIMKSALVNDMDRFLVSTSSFNNDYEYLIKLKMSQKAFGTIIIMINKL